MKRTGLSAAEALKIGVISDGCANFSTKKAAQQAAFLDWGVFLSLRDGSGSGQTRSAQDAEGIYLSARSAHG